MCEEWNGLHDDVVAVRLVNAFKRKLDHHKFEEREGVFLSTCFFPLLMAIHGDLLLEAWMDPGNPGNQTIHRLQILYVFLHIKRFKFSNLPIFTIVSLFLLTFCLDTRSSDSSVLSIPYVRTSLGILRTFSNNNNNNIHLGTHKIKDNQINK